MDPVRSITQKCTPPLVPPAKARALAEEIEAESSDQPKTSVDPVSTLSADTLVIDVMVVYTPAALEVEGGTNVNFLFSYCMHSAWGIEGANGIQVSINSGSSWIELWSNSGEADNDWYVQDIDLNNFSGQSDVHLRFKAELGPTWTDNYLCLDAFSVTGTVVSADRDGDGVPDDRETTYFGSPTNANPTATASNQVNTVMETYIAGIAPTPDFSPNSCCERG